MSKYLLGRMCPQKKKQKKQNKRQASEQCFPSQHDSDSFDWNRAWWALNWFHSSIRMVVFGPSSAKFHRGNAFSWHMLWHTYNWASCQHTTPAKPECNMESERDVTASRESLKIDKCRVLASLHPLVCVCVFLCSCPSLHVSTRQLEAWPPVGLAGLPPVKAWEPSEEEKLAVTLQEHGSTPSDTHIWAHTHIHMLSGGQGVHLPTTRAAKRAKLWPLSLSAQTLRFGLGW